jgi:hypothetical protein
MGFEVLLPAAATLLGGVMGADSSRRAANTAADAQNRATDAAMGEQQRQFDSVRQLLQPYVQTGTNALGQQSNLAGANGNDAQAQAIQALMQSPQFTSAQRLGENRILANASATGGLRGGNVQAALAQFSPALLASTINDQYQRLGGLSSMGQNAAAGVGNAGMSTGNNISNLLGQIGSANAGAALAGGRADLSMINSGTNALGQLVGSGALRNFGGNPLQAAFSNTGLGSSGFGSGMAFGNQDLGMYF